MGSSFDVTSVVSTIGEIPMAEIGTAIIGVAVIAVGYKWIKGMLFS